eukprot:TRINITY_DN6217_c0_g1_i1.p2 TRINITY_DN6217_c0_g1~~TRINITY_DN6217_c0_g1_i1.p2  ORF type:complete len:288 (-),score=96.45 TRINITY_DN6217_c0_g1_i1:489-1352(-)
MEDFRFTDFDWIGFDLDHTLVRYRLRALHELIFDCLVSYLVDDLSYPQRLKQNAVRHEFVKKGVVVDTYNGNLLKLDGSMRVARAFHGSRRMSDADVELVYGGERVVDYPSDQYSSLPTYFEAACADVFALIVDQRDSDASRTYPDATDPLPSSDYLNCWRHIVTARDHSFCSFTVGRYFPAVLGTPSKYLRKQPHVRRWLQGLRKHGVKLLLLTNSMADYTDLLMKFSYGDDWKDLFDLIVVHAKKPHFFVADNHFAGQLASTVLVVVRDNGVNMLGAPGLGVGGC